MNIEPETSERIELLFEAVEKAVKNNKYKEAVFIIIIVIML